MRHILVEMVAVFAVAALAITTISSTAFAGSTVLAASGSANVDESASLRVTYTSNPFGDISDSAASTKSWSGAPAIDVNTGPLSDQEEDEERRLEEEEEEVEEEDRVRLPFNG